MIPSFGLRNKKLLRFLDPGAWLIAVFIPHTLFGGIIPMLQADTGTNEFDAATYALVNSAVLLAILMFSRGTSRARLTACVGGAVFVWILFMSVFAEQGGLEFSAELAPPFIYKFSINIDLAPPMALWGFLTVSGLAHWNEPKGMEEE